MDNISRLYASRFHLAAELAKQNKKAECLDICWELRCKPDLSLYRRAHVNHLIANTVDLKKYPDAAKYAQECTDLVEEVLAQGLSNDPEYLKWLAADAKKVKEKIDQQVSKLEEEEKAENKDVETEERNWIEVDPDRKMEARILEALNKKYGSQSSENTGKDGQEQLDESGSKTANEEA